MYLWVGICSSSHSLQQNTCKKIKLISADFTFTTSSDYTWNINFPFRMICQCSDCRGKTLPFLHNQACRGQSRTCPSFLRNRSCIHVFSWPDDARSCLIYRPYTPAWFYLLISKRIFSSCHWMFSKSSKLSLIFCSNVLNDFLNSSLL